MAEWGNRDNREHMRMEFDGGIVFNIRGNDELFKGNCGNLSHTGVQFETSASLSEGFIIDASINTADGRFEPLKLSFVVVRVEWLSDGKYKISGEIMRIDDKDLKIR